MIKLIKDLWLFIRHVLWQAWKTHRQIMKSQRAIKKMEDKDGVCNTFLLFLEEAIAHNVHEEEIKWMIGTFLECSDDKVRAEESWEDVISYVKKYNVNPLDLDYKSG